MYPDCRSYFNGSNPDQHVVVRMNFNGQPEQLSAALGESFSMAVWLALAIHAAVVEVYVSETVLSNACIRSSSFVSAQAHSTRNPEAPASVL
jgi:hypothetical protein